MECENDVTDCPTGRNEKERAARRELVVFFWATWSPTTTASRGKTEEEKTLQGTWTVRTSSTILLITYLPRQAHSSFWTMVRVPCAGAFLGF